MVDTREIARAVLLAHKIRNDSFDAKADDGYGLYGVTINGAAMQACVKLGLQDHYALVETMVNDGCVEGDKWARNEAGK